MLIFIVVASVARYLFHLMEDRADQLRPLMEAFEAKPGTAADVATATDFGSAATGRLKVAERRGRRQEARCVTLGWRFVCDCLLVCIFSPPSFSSALFHSLLLCLATLCLLGAGRTAWCAALP